MKHIHCLTLIFTTFSATLASAGGIGGFIKKGTTILPDVSNRIGRLDKGIVIHTLSTPDSYSSSGSTSFMIMNDGRISRTDYWNGRRQGSRILNERASRQRFDDGRFYWVYRKAKNSPLLIRNQPPQPRPQGGFGNRPNSYPQGNRPPFSYTPPQPTPQQRHQMHMQRQFQLRQQMQQLEHDTTMRVLQQSMDAFNRGYYGR